MHKLLYKINQRCNQERANQKSQIEQEIKAEVCTVINRAVKGCPDNNQGWCTSCRCVLSNYLTVTDSRTLRGKVDDSSSSAATLLPNACGLFVRTVWCFYFGTVQWSLFRKRIDIVTQPGTIDKGYGCSAVWLEGRYNDSDSSHSERFLSLPSVSCIIFS